MACTVLHSTGYRGRSARHTRGVFHYCPSKKKENHKPRNWSARPPRCVAGLISLVRQALSPRSVATRRRGGANGSRTRLLCWAPPRPTTSGNRGACLSSRLCFAFPALKPYTLPPLLPLSSPRPPCTSHHPLRVTTSKRPTNTDLRAEETAGAHTNTSTYMHKHTYKQAHAHTHTPARAGGSTRAVSPRALTPCPAPWLAAPSARTCHTPSAESRPPAGPSRRPGGSRPAAAAGA